MNDTSIMAITPNQAFYKVYDIWRLMIQQFINAN